MANRSLAFTAPTVRVLRRDGSFNVSRVGIVGRGLNWGDLYHSLLAMSWPRFLIGVGVIYLSLNLIFASGFYFLGPQAFAGLSESTSPHHFADCFFFSVQTLATIGYGHISPVTISANILVTIEALTGLLCFGILTGILFSRFSKPTARVTFSQVAVITQHEGVPTLMLRVANQRLNQIVEADISAVLMRTVKTKEGGSFRKMLDLKLTRNHSPLFFLTWTVMHPIDEASPLKDLTNQDLETGSAEIMISLTGMDETFSQSIYSRFSYTAAEIMRNHRFADVVSRNPDGTVGIDLSRLHDVVAEQ